MQRRRRTEHHRTYPRSGFGTRALLALSALVLLTGLISRFTGTDGLTATVLTTASPTPLTVAFDETVESRTLSLDAETWYCLQSGIFSTEAAAREKSAVYQDRGAPGYVVPDGEKFRVLLCAYATREEAQAVRERLASQQNVDTYVYEMTCPDLRLQLTGMRGQLDVLDAAEALLPALARQWRDAALAVDQGQMTLSEVTALAAEQAEQCQVMRSTFVERFTAPLPPLAQQLQALLQEAEASAQRVRTAAERDLTHASAQMIMEALAGHQALKAAREALLNP